ncbi:MAG: transcriptional regulator, Fis family [Phycisphaerales bacterium]|nr:transcriptional regulator, Fis family [Phycisphaerales bacterium]
MTKTAFKTASAFALAISAAGCMVGPNYKKPETQLAPAYSATQPASTQPMVEVPPVDLARWWETFNDPQLNQLISDAVASNFDVQIAQARVRQARAQLDVAYGGLFPTVDGSASYSRARASKTTSSATFTGTSSGTGTGTTGGAAGGAAFGGFNLPTETDLFQGGFDAGWELDVFGGQRRTIEAAYGTFEAQVDARRGAFVTLLSEVARNYILLRGYQYQLAIADKNIAAQVDTVQLQQQKLTAGISTDLTVAQAQALLASTQAQRPTIQTQVSQAIHRLGILLGREPTALQTQLETASPIPVGPPSIPPGLPSELLRRRPDVRQAERTLASATASIGVATAELFPKFSLNGSIGLSSAKFTNWGDSNSIFWSVGPSVQWRLFDAGAIRANIRVEEAARDAAMLTYRQTVYQAVSDVEDSLVAYDREQARTKSLQESVDANRRALNLARQLNDAGVVDFLNVLTAQQSLFQAEDLLAQSQQTVSTNLVAVYKALGGGWETTETPPQPPLAPATQPLASR